MAVPCVLNASMWHAACMQADSRPKAKGPGPRKKKAPVTTVYVQKPPGRRAPGKYVLGGRQPG